MTEGDWTRYRGGAHPPTCSCVECTNRRLGRLRSGRNWWRRLLQMLHTMLPRKLQR